MAIQNRRGIFSDLDPTKLLPGEYAVVISGDPDNTDGNGVYICFAPGQVKKIALTEDMSLDGKIYPDLTAGDILANTYAENKTPYFFRPSGGGAEVGTLEAPVLVGGSVGWNQLMPEYSTPSTSNGITITRSGGHYTATGTPSATWASVGSSRSGDLTQGHVYIMSLNLTKNTVPTTFSFSTLGGGTVNPTFNLSNLNALGHYAVIRKSGITSTTGVNFGFNALTSGTDIGTIEFDFSFIDLTLLLGSTIADRLYTLEQSTAGSGIAQLRAWGFDFDAYVPYSAPTLKHVEGVSAHVMRGFNQWDEELEIGTIGTNGVKVNDPTYVRSKNYIPVLPSTEYFVKTGSSLHRVFFYDANKEFISFNYSTNANGKVYTTPTNCHYMLFRPENTYGTTYNHDICINISNTAKNGQYEPYKTWSYALDGNVTIRGIPKLDASNNLYYDGDTYEPDGTVTRRYGVVDLGTLNWSLGTRGYFIGEGLPSPKAVEPASDGNFICGKYARTTFNSMYDTHPDKTISLTNGSNDRVYISDSSYSDAVSLKASLSGIYIVYELETSTTETATPFAEYQEVDASGTEEYVSTGVVPVGHVTKYPTDIKGAVESILSAIPSNNGTYALKVTVANGKRTFSWV